MNRRMRVRPGVWLLVGIALSACDATGVLAPVNNSDARQLNVDYAWELEGWDQGVARGYPVALLSWELPARYDREAFRVYARRASSGSYGLIATVTSCADGVCRYSDTNIAAGSSYDYYVATFDERNGTEVGISTAIRIDVPHPSNLAAPSAPTAVSLDRAVYLHWPRSDNVERYTLLVQLDDGSTFVIGETDGASFFDGRVDNGTRYRYHLASTDVNGHVSDLSQAATAFPRPDYHADVVYAHDDRPAESGFRFVDNETDNPIRSGTATTAQWRLESVAGTLRIQPLNGSAITVGRFTTELSCGPGSDADCEDIRVAPAAAEFGTGSAVVETGHTYILRVTGSDNQTHYAKLRVQGATTDVNGHRLIVFDWAIQLRPNEPTLNRSGL